MCPQPPSSLQVIGIEHGDWTTTTAAAATYNGAATFDTVYKLQLSKLYQWMLILLGTAKTMHIIAIITRRENLSHFGILGHEHYKFLHINIKFTREMLDLKQNILK